MFEHCSSLYQGEEQPDTDLLLWKNFLITLSNLILLLTLNRDSGMRNLYSHIIDRVGSSSFKYPLKPRSWSWMKLWRRQWAPDSTGDRAACITILRNVDWIDWRSETKKSPRSDLLVSFRTFVTARRPRLRNVSRAWQNRGAHVMLRIGEQHNETAAARQRRSPVRTKWGIWKAEPYNAVIVFPESARHALS